MEEHKKEAHSEHKKDSKSHEYVKNSEQKEHHVHHIHHKKPVHHKSTSHKSSNEGLYSKLIIVFGIALVVFSIFNFIIGANLNSSISDVVSDAKEKAKPAKLQIIVLKDSNCENCFDIDSIVDSVKKKNVEIKKEEELDYNSKEGKKLIEKYGIEKIPSVIISGQIDKSNIRNFETIDETLVFKDLKPLYTNAKTGEIVGKVSSTLLLDSKCTECTDLNRILDLLKESGINFDNEKTVDLNSREGQELVNRYSLTIAPSLILSEGLKDYESDIVDAWNQLGSIENDGTFVTRDIAPPYINVTSGNIVGKVSITYLTDSTCTDCYDPEAFHGRILKSMGLFVDNTEKIDSASTQGQRLINQYSITKLPTILLSGDTDKYPVLVGAWRNVGSIESDGTFIFRRVEVANQPFKDLTKSVNVTSG